MKRTGEVFSRPRTIFPSEDGQKSSPSDTVKEEDLVFSKEVITTPFLEEMCGVFFRDLEIDTHFPSLSLQVPLLQKGTMES
jgi:hypothetical protein